jgi:hypothetical protein
MAGSTASPSTSPCPRSFKYRMCPPFVRKFVLRSGIFYLWSKLRIAYIRFMANAERAQHDGFLYNDKEGTMRYMPFHINAHMKNLGGDEETAVVTDIEFRKSSKSAAWHEFIVVKVVEKGGSRKSALMFERRNPQKSSSPSQSPKSKDAPKEKTKKERRLEHRFCGFLNAS